MKPDRLEREEKNNMPLGPVNFLFMAIAGAVIILGFVLMCGSSNNGSEFNPDIFSTRRIIVGPTVAFLGFLFMGWAIMMKSRHKSK